MRIYEDETLIEWSRKLRSEYGNNFRLYSTEEETMERWKDHLSNRLGYKFEFEADQDDTMDKWSRLIGG